MTTIRHGASAITIAAQHLMDASEHAKAAVVPHQADRTRQITGS